MKKKAIIIISVIVVLALGGTLAFAATKDGELVNPFSKILGEKVEDGTISEDEANTFSKVWNAIKGEKGKEEFRMGRKDKMMSREEKPKLDEETITELKAAAEEIKTAIEVKVEEEVTGLISEGYITQEQVDELDDKPFAIWTLVKDADEATQEALKEAMTEVKEYQKTLVNEMIENGELDEDIAALMQNGKSNLRSGKATGREKCERPGVKDTNDN